MWRGQDLTDKMAPPPQGALCERRLWRQLIAEPLGGPTAARATAASPASSGDRCAKLSAWRRAIAEPLGEPPPSLPHAAGPASAGAGSTSLPAGRQLIAEPLGGRIHSLHGYAAVTDSNKEGVL
jgi:hypothetical protein